jgi:hypothetical protein
MADPDQRTRSGLKNQIRMEEPDPDGRTRTRSRNIGGGVVFKVRLTQASFGARNIGGGVGLQSEIDSS